jgi:hypothetical protein
LKIASNTSGSEVAGRFKFIVYPRFKPKDWFEFCEGGKVGGGVGAYISFLTLCLGSSNVDLKLAKLFTGFES